MSNDHAHAANASAAAAAAAADAPPYVQLFQRAHQHIVMLDRLEEQLAQLWSKRMELQEELRDLQQQINEELEDRINGTGESPKSVLANIAGVVTATPAGNASGAGQANGPSRNSSGRFASQSLTSMAE